MIHGVLIIICQFEINHDFIISNSFRVIVIINSYEPQEFSSEPSGQFFSPLQNSPRSIQDLSPQDNSPSYSNVKYKCILKCVYICCT